MKWGCGITGRAAFAVAGRTIDITVRDDATDSAAAVLNLRRCSIESHFDALLRFPVVPDPLEMISWSELDGGESTLAIH